MDDDAAGGRAAASERSEDDPGIGLSSSGDLVLERSALGSRVYRLAATVIYAKWDVANCGPRPDDVQVEPPGDLPDTCFYKMLTLVTRHVSFSLDAQQIVMREGEQQLGRFPVTSSSDKGSVAFRFDPSVVHVKVALASNQPEFAVPVLDTRTTARKSAGWIAVTQNGSLQLPGGAPPAPVRVKYGISERRVNDAFAPSYQREDAPKHFYEINHPDRPIGKFDFTRERTVTFRSVGLPAQHRATAEEALRGAVDYWNRVFRAASGQRERVFFAAEPAEAGVFVHDPGHNVLQWSTYPKNSASMGVFQTDGVTGEILFSNGFISAGFFDAARNVSLKLRDHVKASATPEAAVTQFTADYILETIAHEIGHMVGLQHNFQASNIGSSHKPNELAPVGRDYFDTGRVPDDLSTSVMEYLPIPLAGMLGRHMRTQILAHDVDAVSRAYYGRTTDLASAVGPNLAGRAAALPYCNDEAGADGCTQFDHALCAVAGAYCFTSEL